MRLLPRRLFPRLALALGGVVVLALAVDALLLQRVGRTFIQPLVEENLRHRAEHVLTDIDRHLARCAADVASWAALDVMGDVVTHDGSFRIQNLLLRLQRANPDRFRTLTVIDKQHEVVASSDARLVDQPAPFELEALQAASLPATALREERVPRTPVHPRILAQPIVTPYSKGPLGWLAADLDWNAVSGIIAKHSSPGPDPDHFFVLLDREGNVLAAPEGVPSPPEPFEVLSARASGGRIVSERLPGVGTYLAAYQALEAARSPIGARLRLLAFWRRSAAFSVVSGFARAVLGAGALGLLLAGLVAFVVARNISTPVQDLVRGTQRIARGDLAHRIDDRREDELGDLARSFNRMGRRLSFAKAQLEESRAHWEALVAHVPDLILTISQQGTVLSANRALGSLSLQQSVGSNILDQLDAEGSGSVREMVDRVFAGSEMERCELHLRDGDESRWFALRAAPIRRGLGIAAAVLVAADITDRKRLEREVLDATETERERIGQDLHDGVGQVLTGTSFLARGLQQRLESGGVPEAAEAGRIADLLAQAIEETRALAHGMYSVSARRGSLLEALSELAEESEELTGVRCRIAEVGELAPLEPQVATHLYRIAQEAVNNALKHARCSEITLTLFTTQGKQGLRIEDNGRGIPPDLNGSGIGLHLMRYRASVIGAEFEISNRPGGGTAVTCRL